MEKNEGEHTLTLTNRRHLEIGGVTNVISYNDREILLETNRGRLHLGGENLHILGLNLKEEQLLVEGLLHELVYMEDGKGLRGKNFLERIFR